MATRTVVIESNRELAYALEGESASTADTFPKDRWKTKIEPALEVEVGDTIRLEASMLNAVGAGDSVMEFIGETSKQYEGKSLLPVPEHRGSHDQVRCSAESYHGANKRRIFPQPRHRRH